MSVDVEQFLIEQGLDWTFSLQGFLGYSLVRLPAVSARNLGQVVEHVPVTGNPAHAEVKGKKSPGTANSLLANSTAILITPPAS
jgi:hypothetical protein